MNEGLQICFSVAPNLANNPTAQAFLAVIYHSRLAWRDGALRLGQDNRHFLTSIIVHTRNLHIN